MAKLRVAVTWIAVTFLALSWTRGAWSEERKVWPLLWGVNDNADCLRKPKLSEIFDDFGFDLFVVHYTPKRPTISTQVTDLKLVDAWCGERGIKWIINLESANWIKSYVDEKGRDWYNHPDGRHYFLFPGSVLAELGKLPNLLGLLYDEAEHMQNCRNMIADVNKPYMLDTRGLSLPQASDAFTKAARRIADRHRRYGLQLYTEHVMPVMFHNFAKAGYVAAPKVLKESWSPVYIACAMGAALQYGTELWISPDLWFGQDYPGHTPEQYRSALLLAYHMGPDCIYTENLAWRPPMDSLVRLRNDGYTVTALGEVARWFRSEYVAAHPRHYSFRDVKPRVAIVRQEDSCWGQDDSFLPDSLFGDPNWPSTPTTEAWFKIWSLLSRGVVSPYALNWINRKYRERPYQVFCPLDGVVVFDETASERHLRGCEVIFMTGIGVSTKTQRAVAKCVRDGATCVALPHLLPEEVRSKTGINGVFVDGAGCWVSTDDFLAPHVREHVQQVLPTGDTIRYRFADTEVTFLPVNGNPNDITVKTQSITDASATKS